jgi:antitoxin (DNA-binding transcriptional repressor) of toxin-antitoxin stability system
MSTLTLEEAQSRLKDVIAGIGPGEELVITQDGEPVALLTRASVERVPRAPRRPGNCKGMFTITSDDEDHLHSIDSHGIIM